MYAFLSIPSGGTGDSLIFLFNVCRGLRRLSKKKVAMLFFSRYYWVLFFRRSFMFSGHALDINLDSFLMTGNRLIKLDLLLKALKLSKCPRKLDGV